MMADPHDYSVYVSFSSSTGSHILVTNYSLLEEDSFRQIAIKLIDMYGSETQILFVREDFLYSVAYFKTITGKLSRQNITGKPDLINWIESGELISIGFA